MLSLFDKSSSKMAALALLVLGSAQLAGCSSREQRAQAYYEQGMSYLAKNDYVKAGIQFKNALQIKARFGRGFSRSSKGRRAWRELASARRRFADHRRI